MDYLTDSKMENVKFLVKDSPENKHENKDISEYHLLKSMWKEKVRRSTDLIVPFITYEGMKGSLNNLHWFFDVGYHFRDALNIKYEERKKNKKPYMVWTQGPVISFKDGDLINSKDNTIALQVTYASPMGWDESAGVMYQGNVTYKEYAIKDKAYELIRNKTCNQMEFLKILITGKME